MDVASKSVQKCIKTAFFQMASSGQYICLWKEVYEETMLLLSKHFPHEFLVLIASFKTDLA